MSRNSRHPPSSSIFWPVDDVDGQSTASSSVQPVIDASKQRRSSLTAEGLDRQSFQARPALGSLLFRRHNSTSPSSTTLISHSPMITLSTLLPEKYEIPQSCSQTTARDDYCSRSVSAPFWPKWTNNGSMKEATKMQVRRSSSVDCRSDDGCTPWCRNDDEKSRHKSSSVEFCSITRRSSEPSVALTKCPSATSLSTLGRNVDRRRPWTSKYLRQFVETDDEEEKPMPRRKSNVAALINDFEQWALQYGTLERPPTTIPRGGLGCGTLHSSLTNLDSIDRTHGHGWSICGKAADDSGSDRHRNARIDLVSTKSPLSTSQPSPRLKSYGEYVKTWKTENDHDEAANIIRRSSVDVICRALHGSLTHLDSVGRARGWHNSSEKAAGGDSSRTTPPSTRTYISRTKSSPLTSNDHTKLDDEHVNNVRSSSSVGVITPAARYSSDYIVKFKTKPGQPVHPHEQRRLSVLIGRRHVNSSDNTDSSIKSTPATADIHMEAPGNLTDVVNELETADSCECSQWVRNTAHLRRSDCHCRRTSGKNQQKTSESCEPECASTPWVSRLKSQSLPVAATHCDSSSNWINRPIPSFPVVDDVFESAFWQHGGNSSPRRTGSLVSDSNNTEDSGVALSEYMSPVVDWSQKLAQNGGGWSQYGSKSGPWMTCRDNEDEKMSTTTYRSQDHADIKLIQSKSVLHGIFLLI